MWILFESEVFKKYKEQIKIKRAGNKLYRQGQTWTEDTTIILQQINTHIHIIHTSTLPLL